MPDYLYTTSIILDLSRLPRGTGGTAFAQPNSNIAPYGNSSPGPAPLAQSLRLSNQQMMGNAVTIPPTITDIQNAMNVAVNELVAQITPAQLAMIQNWALGGE